MILKFNAAAAAAVVALAGAASLSALPVAAVAAEGKAPVPQTAEGMGVVKAVDAAAGTVTIAHDPIPALKWPAMTMKFTVESAAVLEGVAAGKTVHFVLRNIGGKPVVTQIHVM